MVEAAVNVDIKNVTIHIWIEFFLDMLSIQKLLGEWQIFEYPNIYKQFPSNQNQAIFQSANEKSIFGRYKSHLVAWDLELYGQNETQTTETPGREIRQFTISKYIWNLTYDLSNCSFFASMWKWWRNTLET